jgi:hypothetical protein
MPHNIGSSTFFRDWTRFWLAYSQMSLAAAEVIARRSLQMAQGSMSRQESLRMVTEKTSALVGSTQGAARAATAGASPPRILEAALRPYRKRTSANVRRLRR